MTRLMMRRERQQAEAEERHQDRQEALAALQKRAGRYTGRHGAAAREAAAVESARDLRPVHARAVVHTASTEDADGRAGSRVEDRVHAWYRSQHPAAVNRDDVGNDVETSANVKVAARPVPARTVAVNTEPDLSTTAHKATAEDFARAAAAQRETIAAVRDQQARQTTSDDDNADAESRIPSTAPTEREPAPFVHGSFGEDAMPASHSQRQPAPIVRQPPALTAPAISIAPPQHVDLKHRGDGLNTALAADAAAQSASSAAGSRSTKTIPIMAADDSSPRAIRALAQETAASPTPALKLPAPPAGALHKELPAVAAVQSGARRRELDPTVANGMAEENFEGDAPATARTAVALAAPNPVAALVPTRTHAVPATVEDSLPAAAVVSVNLFDGQGRLILVPPMKGSHEILVHQNTMAVSDGLSRIQDDRDLLDLRQRKLLVALPDEDSSYPDDRLPVNRRYARPWTVRFLRDLARAHYARFGTPLIVTSAARTVEFQRRLVRINGNAAPPTGDIASPHLYGQAIDIGKGRMGLTELTWMRAYLTPVENDGKIDVEEEFQQSCFHISVYRRYLGLSAPNRTLPAQSAPVPMLTAKQAPAPEESKPIEKKRRRISAAMLATGLR